MLTPTNGLYVALHFIRPRNSIVFFVETTAYETIEIIGSQKYCNLHFAEKGILRSLLYNENRSPRQNCLLIEGYFKTKINILCSISWCFPFFF